MDLLLMTILSLLSISFVIWVVRLTRRHDLTRNWSLVARMKRGIAHVHRKLQRSLGGVYRIRKKDRR